MLYLKIYFNRKGLIMSQNNCTLYFYSQKSELNDIVEKVKEQYAKKDVSIFNIEAFSLEVEAEENLGERNYGISFDTQGPDKALLEACQFLAQGLGSDEPLPLASIYWDQAGMSSYFGYVDEKVLGFPSFEDVAIYLKRDIANAPETKFYKDCEDLDIFMLVRLKFDSQDDLSKFQTVCKAFINGEMQGDIQTFGQALDQLMDTTYVKPEPYLSCNELSKEQKDDFVNILKSLSFCQSEGYYVYLGFCDKSLINSATQVINVVTPAMEISIPLGYVKGADSELTYAKIVEKKTEWHIYYLDETAFFCFESDKKPATLWA